jgi:hypothetical protein
MVGWIFTRLPSNFGMFEGSLSGIGGQVVTCKMGSLLSFVKYGIFNDTIYNKLGELVVYWFGYRIPFIFPKGWGTILVEEGPLDGFFYVSAPNKVDLRKDEPNNVD